MTPEDLADLKNNATLRKRLAKLAYLLRPRAQTGKMVAVSAAGCPTIGDGFPHTIAFGTAMVCRLA